LITERTVEAKTQALEVRWNSQEGGLHQSRNRTR